MTSVSVGRQNKVGALHCRVSRMISGIMHKQNNGNPGDSIGKRGRRQRKTTHRQLPPNQILRFRFDAGVTVPQNRYSEVFKFRRNRIRVSKLMVVIAENRIDRSVEIHQRPNSSASFILTKRNRRQSIQAQVFAVNPLNNLLGPFCVFPPTHMKVRH